MSLRQHFLACALPKKRRAEPDDYKLEHMPELEPIEFEPLERRDPGRHGLLGLFLSWWLRLRMVLRPG